MNFLKKGFVYLVTGLSAAFSLLLLFFAGSGLFNVVASTGYFSVAAFFILVGLLFVSIPWIFFLLCKKFKDDKWLALIDLLWLIFIIIFLLVIFQTTIYY